MTVSDTIERVARAWASIDGKAKLFEADKGRDHHDPASTGHYEGYLSEAAELLKRTALRPGDELPNGLVVVLAASQEGEQV